MTLNPMCDNVETKQGVPLTVTGVAQVKIMKDPQLLEIAAEQFLGKRSTRTGTSLLLWSGRSLSLMLARWALRSFPSPSRTSTTTWTIWPLWASPRPLL